MKVPVEREWWMRHAAPVVVLLGSLMILVPFIDDPDMIWAAIATPLAILLGFAVHPERVWITPLATALLITTAIVIAAVLDEIEPRTSLPMLYVWTLALVALPLVAWTWLGKLIRSSFDQELQSGTGSPT